MNKGKFLKLIRVKPQEAKVVLYTFIFCICLGAAQNILFSVPLAMFLSRFSSAYLPHIYIATGVAMFFMGLGLSYLEKKVTVFYVLAGPIALFAASLLIFWLLLQVVTQPVIFIALVIWALVIGGLLISLAMVLFNQLFTFQQSKRVYGLLFGGIALGGVIIGLGMDFLIKVLGAIHLILLATALTGCGFLMQFPIRMNSRGKLLSVEADAAGPKTSWKSVKNKRYILQVFLFTTLVYFIYYTLDLLLNTMVQKQFPAESEMAVFFGILYAAYDVASLITGFVIVSWLLTRFGLIVSLLLYPIGLLALLSVAIAVNLIPSFAFALFPIILAAAVFETTTRESLTYQSILLLFQPLRPTPRAWAQLKNESIVVPLAMTFIGVILLTVQNHFGKSVSVMGLMIVGLTLAAVALVFTVIKGGYLQLLMESLSKRVISNPKFTKLTKDSLDVLKNRLQSNYPEETIYVLTTIENINKVEFEKLLWQALDSPLEQVRIFALNKIEHYRINAFIERLSAMCQNEKNPEVLAAALLAYASTTHLKGADWFKQFLSDPHPDVSDSCMISLIRYGKEADKTEAIGLLMRQSQSDQEEERMKTARVLKLIQIKEKDELLLALLKDRSMKVRDAAASSALNVSDERIFHALVENLGIPQVHDAAMKALSSLGKKVLDYILRQFAHYPQPLQIHLITMLGFIKERKAVEFLETLLSNPNRKMLHPTVQSLKKLSYKTSNEDLIQKLLIEENENILFLKEFIAPFQFEKMRILHDFICREIELSQECCFYLLSFVYPDEAIMQVKMGLSLDDEEMNSNAVELLLQTLESKDQKLFADQLNFHPYKQEVESHAEEVEIKELLLKVRDYTANCYISALPAAVVYEIGILKLKSLVTVVIKQELKDDQLMQEIQPISLKKLSHPMDP